MADNEKSIACRAGCGRQTAMLGTRLCDYCWEIDRRSHNLLELLRVNRFHDAQNKLQHALQVIFDPTRFR